MVEAKYDVLGIGNAIFDVLVRTDEKFLADHGMTKGGMALIDETRAAAIYRDMGPATQMSGGSAANTIVGLASLGARAAYVGKVRDDEIGRLSSPDIPAAGVAFETRPASSGPATRCSHHPLPRRPAGSDARRHRRRAGRVREDPLSRRLSVGPLQRQGRLREGCED